jgi:hypothetical protein
MGVDGWSYKRKLTRATAQRGGHTVSDFISFVTAVTLSLTRLCDSLDRLRSGSRQESGPIVKY